MNLIAEGIFMIPFFHSKALFLFIYSDMNLNIKINEQLRLKFLKLYEDFSKKSTPDELKYIASKIRPD